MLVHKSRLSAYAVYLIFTGLFNLAFSCIATLSMVYQVEVVRLNPLQLVLVGTTLETVAFVCQVPTGVLADMYSRRLSVILGVFLTGIAFILEGSIPRFEVVVFAQGLFGIGASLQDGAEQAWVADEMGEKQVRRVLLRSTQIGLITGMLGALVSVALGSFRLNIPLLTGGGLAILSAVFLLLFMPEAHFHRVKQGERHSWYSLTGTFRDGFRAVRGRPLLITILGIALIYGLFSEGIDRLSTAHLLTDVVLPSLGQFKPVVWFGILSVASTILTLAATELVRQRANMSDQRVIVRVLFVLNVLGVGSILAFAFAGNFFLALAALLALRVFRSVNEPIFVTWLTQNSEAKVRATIISLRGQLDALGQIAGGPPVGLLGNLFSIRIALASTAAILSPVLGLLLYAARKIRHSTQPEVVEKEEDRVPIA